MKITTNQPEAAFKPVAITLTFETQRELDAFGCLFNVWPIADTIENYGIDPAVIYNIVQKAGGDIDSLVEVIAEDIKRRF